MVFKFVQNGFVAILRPRMRVALHTESEYSVVLGYSSEHTFALDF